MFALTNLIILALARVWDPERLGYLPLSGIYQFYNDCNIAETDRKLHLLYPDKVLYHDFVIWATSCPSVSKYLDYLSFMIGCVCLGAPLASYLDAAKMLNKIVLDVEPDQFHEWVILTNNQYTKIIEALGTEKSIRANPSDSLVEQVLLFADSFVSSPRYIIIAF